jgi:hypothetical protein
VRRGNPVRGQPSRIGRVLLRADRRMVLRERRKRPSGGESEAVPTVPRRASKREKSYKPAMFAILGVCPKKLQVVTVRRGNSIRGQPSRIGRVLLRADRRAVLRERPKRPADGDESEAVPAIPPFGQARKVVQTGNVRHTWRCTQKTPSWDGASRQPRARAAPAHWPGYASSRPPHSFAGTTQASIRRRIGGCPRYTIVWTCAKSRTNRQCSPYLEFVLKNSKL